MHVPGIKLKDVISLDKLHSVHYFEFSSNYSFPGENHNFWEMVYVDKGKINVVAGDACFELEHGYVYFHRPNQWHTLVACEGVASNIAVISFSSVSEAMDQFSDLTMKVTAEEKQLLSDIISEARLSFHTELGDPYKNRLYPRKDAPVGSQQMIKIRLLDFLIRLLRRNTGMVMNSKFTEVENGLFVEICAYMKQNLSNKLTLKDLAITFGMSASSLKILFKKHTGTGVIHYFINLKMDRAKELLRSRKFNVTQISAILGYENIYAFSAQFKRFTQMSPTEYLMSIRSLEKT